MMEVSLLLIFISIMFLCAIKIYEIVCNKKAQDRYNKFLNEKLIMSSFAMQLQNPKLNDIFVNDTSKKDMSEEAVATRRNFIVYILSVFDFATDYYYGPSGYSIVDPALKIAWENTVFDYFRDSDEIVDVFHELKNEFNIRFQKYAEEVIKRTGRG